MADVIRRYSDDLFPTGKTERPGFSGLMAQNPLTEIIANALRNAQAQAASKNVGEYKGSESKRAITNFAKDFLKGLPSGMREAMIQMAIENAVIPVGKRQVTFSPSESGLGLNAKLSNTFGGDITLGLDPNFYGLTYQRQF